MYFTLHVPSSLQSESTIDTIAMLTGITVVDHGSRIDNDSSAAAIVNIVDFGIVTVATIDTAVIDPSTDSSVAINAITTCNIITAVDTGTELEAYVHAGAESCIPAE